MNEIGERTEHELLQDVKKYLKSGARFGFGMGKRNFVKAEELFNVHVMQKWLLETICSLEK